jgi:hypothetical protein
MNVDVVALFCLGLIGCVVCLSMFYILNRRTNFSNAKPNRVYNFDYIQPVTGQRERFFAKVVDNDSWTMDQIRRLNFHSNYRWNDSNFKREGNLVTCVMPNGDSRRFWSGRVENCKIVPIGSLMYRFASLII